MLGLVFVFVLAGVLVVAGSFLSFFLIVFVLAGKDEAQGAYKEEEYGQDGARRLDLSCHRANR